MRITDIILKIYRYVATIKVMYGKSYTTTRTIIYADGMSQAKALLVASYGENSVLAIFRISENHLKETAPNGTKHWRKPRVLPTTFKHDIVQQELLNQLKRGPLRVKPTVDDLHAAQDEFDVQQRRVNREYKNKQKWAEIRKRRMS